MRKLTLLATTAIAALALAAAAAPAANADRAFHLVAPGSGAPCSPCYDTGYAGDFDVESFTGTWQATCAVDFDIRIFASGSFETYNTHLGTCGQTGGVVPCDDSWTGQFRLPDTGPGQIDLQICLKSLFNGQQINHDITLTVYNNPRRWEQATEDHGSSYTIVDSYFADGYPADNIGIFLL
jgi:uncharacterized membrane protein